MQKKSKYGGIVSAFVYVLMLLYFIFKYRTNFNADERTLYVVLLLSYVICGGLVVTAKIRHNLYLLEPFTFAAVLYIGIFNYRPIVDLYNNNMIGNGMNVSSGGVKATIIFTIGFFFFYLGYYSVFKTGRSDRSERQEEYQKLDPGNQASDGAVWGWIISFVFSVIALVSQGASLRYIFSLASAGEKVIEEGSTALLFLSNFGITMVTCWLMVIVRPRKTGTKIIITVLSLIYLIMRNGRWLLLIFVAAPFVYYYTKRQLRPKWINLIGGGFLLLLVFAWMQLNRANIAFGRQMAGWGENGLTLEILLSPFDSDLTTYKVFYGMVTRFPSSYSYMFGATFLYVIVLFVPRAIWAGKPDNPVRDMIEHSMNSLARRSGSAVANIGEFYANFGVLGVVVLMFAFGKIISKLKRLYEEPTEDRLVAYAILLPLLFQWVARGNFSGNFYTTLFALLPFITKAIVKNIFGRRT